MAVFKRHATGPYYVRFVSKGQEIYFSTHLKNKEDALLIEADTRRRLAMGELADPQRIGFESLCRKYLDYMRDKVAQKTWKTYRARITRWMIPYFRSTPVSRITDTDIEKYLTWRKDQPCVFNHKPPEPEELRKHLVLIKQIFTFAIRGKLGARYIRTNPCDDVQAVRVPEIEKRRALSQNEVAALLKYQGWLHGPMLFMIDTGARPGECFNLTWQQINHQTGMVRIYASKTANERELRMTNRLQSDLRIRTPYFNSPFVYYRTGTGNPARDVRKERLRIQRETGVEFLLYELRHTAITRWASDPQIDAPALMYLAGHKSIKTTLRYCHGAKERAAQAIERMGV